MSEKPKAEKSLQAKSPRQKFEDIKVLMTKAAVCAFPQACNNAPALFTGM